MGIFNDFYEPISGIPINQPGFNGKYRRFFFRSSLQFPHHIPIPPYHAMGRTVYLPIHGWLIFIGKYRQIYHFWTMDDVGSDILDN